MKPILQEHNRIKNFNLISVKSDYIFILKVITHYKNVTSLYSNITHCRTVLLTKVQYFNVTLQYFALKYSITHQSTVLLTLQYSVFHYSTVILTIVQYYSLQYSIIHYSIVLFTIVNYYSLQYNITHYITILLIIVRYYSLQYLSIELLTVLYYQSIIY